MPSDRSSESLFLSSLESIQMDLSRTASRSRRHSQSSSGKSEGRAYALPRRATVTSLAPVAHLRRTGSQYNVTTSAPFQPNQLVHLPFQTTPPSESHSVKRYGTVDLEQVQDAKTESSKYASGVAEQRRSEGRAYALPRRATVTSLAPVAHLRCTGSQYNVTTSAPFQPNQLVHLPFQTTPPSESHSVKRYGIIEVEQLQDAKTKSFEDVPLALEQRRKSLEAVDSQQPREQHKSYMTNGSRSDYILGDTVRSPSHMIVEDCSEAALHKASQLKLHDFAFIKRSDGSWTYAILACRNTSEVNNEECMMFVMNETGSIKYIKKRKWASFIRCVVVEDI